jgi:hypothetical protein
MGRRTIGFSCVLCQTRGLIRSACPLASEGFAGRESGNWSPATRSTTYLLRPSRTSLSPTTSRIFIPTFEQQPCEKPWKRFPARTQDRVMTQTATQMHSYINPIAEISRPRSLAARDQECPGNSSIKGRKHCTIRLSELCEMAIGRLLRCFDPRRKVRNIKIVRNKSKLQDVFCLQPEQQRACLGHSKSI